MSEFFIPEASPESTEKIYTAIKSFVQQQMADAIQDRRIERLTFEHGRVVYDLSVGHNFERIGEPVIAILQGTRMFYVCTPNRGVLRGQPYLVGNDEVLRIFEFEVAPRTRTAGDSLDL